MAEKKNKSVEKATVKVATQKEIRLNSDLVGFVATLIEQKIASPGNAQKIQELYEEQVGLKFTNVERVIRRSNRPALLDAKRQLLTEKKLTMVQSLVVEQMLKDISKEKADRNYVSVKI